LISVVEREGGHGGMWLRWGAVVGAVVVASLGVGGATAMAARSVGGLPRPASASPAANGHSKSVVGTYEMFAGSQVFTLLVLQSDHTFTMTAIGDTGLWVTSSKAIAISITASTADNTGCTFSASVTKKSLSSAKKPGNYFCPAGSFNTWYAVKQKTA
jgi:hypothetical protein